MSNPTASPPILQFKLVNPLVNSIFSINDPSKSALKDIYIQLQSNPFSYAFIIPDTYTLLNYYDNTSGIAYRDLCTRQDFVKDHILDLRSHNLTISRNSNVAALLNTRKPKHFTNANGKDLLLKKDTIIINDEYFNGQPSSGEAMDSLIKFKVSKIELFLNFNQFFPKNHEFLLIHINRPLTGTPISEVRFKRMQILPTLQPISVGSATHTRNSSLNLDINQSGTSWHPEFDNPSFTSEVQLVAPKTSFTQLTGRFSVINQELAADFLHLFKNFVIDTITDPGEILTLYKETINQSALIFKSLSEEIISGIITYDPSIDLNRCIYDYVELSLYDRIWNQLRVVLATPQDKETQYLTNETYESLKCLSITQVGIFENFDTKREKLQPQLLIFLSKIASSVKIFSKISLTNTYFDKLKILVQTITELTKQTTINGVRSVDVSADILVALLILVVVESRVEDIHVHLEYIKNFSYYSYARRLDLTTGFVGYCISTIDGVLYHLQNKENISQLISHSMKNQELWEILYSTSASAAPQLIDFIDANTDFDNDVHLPIEHSLRAITKNGESVLSIALSSESSAIAYDLFRTLLTYNENLYPLEDLLFDYNTSHSTLFLECLLQSRLQCADLLLDILLSSCTVSELINYINHQDAVYHRVAGHHIHRYPQLLDKVGLYIDWRVRDISFNTPLVALCRNYDIQDYPSLVTRTFEIVKKWYAVQKMEFDPLDHIDAKGNTLLHILRDGCLQPILSEPYVDVNKFNDRGHCPLVVYVRYGRVNNIKAILEDERLNWGKIDGKTFLTVLDYVKMNSSVASTPNLDQNNEAIISSSNVEKLVDGQFIKHFFPQINGRKFGILRAKLDSNQWCFVMKGSIVERMVEEDIIEPSNNIKPVPVTPTPNERAFKAKNLTVNTTIIKPKQETVTARYKAHHYTNYHSVNDFRSLIHLLHIEYPMSYLPIVYLMDSVFARLNLTTFTFFNFNKLKINEMMLKLNIFLVGLELSRDFYNHELIWEFLILPTSIGSSASSSASTGVANIANFNGAPKAQLEARSRMKIEATKEKLSYGAKSGNLPSTPATPIIEESPISHSPNIPDEFTDSGLENLKELFALDISRNYAMQEVEDILNFLKYSSDELEIFHRGIKKVLQLVVVASHKFVDLETGLDSFAKFSDDNPTFKSFPGYYKKQMESIQERIKALSQDNSKKVANVSVGSQPFASISAMFQKIIVESNTTATSPHIKFAFYLQFLENCVARMIRNINSVINKKILKWLKLAGELNSLKTELRRIRPQDFLNDDVSVLGEETIENPFIIMAPQPMPVSINGGATSGHSRNFSTSSMATLTEEDQVKNDESLSDSTTVKDNDQLQSSSLDAPPLINVLSPDDITNTPEAAKKEQQSDLSTPLRSIDSQTVSPLRSPFASDSSTVSSSGNGSIFGTRPGSAAASPVVKKKRSFLSNILESRKTNHELKVMKQYKVVRLKLMGLSDDVRYSHESLAMEVSHFMEFKEIFMRYAVKVFVKEELRKLKFEKCCIDNGLISAKSEKF
ncbi:hypothetical protein DASC09_041200 [Saccharomycopsis crataegensis]|uniref:VPS9 domain-containing protein n=1 Tax=Saccharomycopsis crataegensis TaxID=43959 RepID=A0AAV5QQH4_9ASCO|nr:hypothetical protein DASC09_041200 [Saccharomycopsis crataegensis]